MNWERRIVTIIPAHGWQAIHADEDAEDCIAKTPLACFALVPMATRIKLPNLFRNGTASQMPSVSAVLRPPMNWENAD